MTLLDWLKRNTIVEKVGKKGYVIRMKPEAPRIIYHGARRHGRNTLLNKLKQYHERNI